MVISTTVCRHVWTIETVLPSRSCTIIWWQATSPGGEQNVSSESRPNTLDLGHAAQLQHREEVTLYPSTQLNDAFCSFITIILSPQKC